ncbi:olfactory receptor 5BS1-like [Carettochelys insculpta]|uniref:olfactory receptor 5BS1-like n=1 Tax=Carettochelys insculpta TaxID=44489 RepID=UPI003EB7EEB0
MEFQTNITVFILTGLSHDPHLQILLFLVFLVIYLITLMGNMMIILVIRADPQLHNPMYFFLSHLSFVDICYSSVVVPQMLVNFLVQHKTILVNVCLTQMFFILLLAVTEIFILSAMAYDRYAAICHPLHYTVTINKRVCNLLLGCSWTMGLIYSLVNTVPVLKLHFCGPNEIKHFSCELPPLLQLSCTGTSTNTIARLSSAVIFGFSSFLPILVSYTFIISTILRMSSVEGRRKAFSTCSSHLIVVGLLYMTALFQYMKPSSVSSPVLDELFSIQYTILTPMLNPIIYSLKNKEMKRALTKLLRKISVCLK